MADDVMVDGLVSNGLAAWLAQHLGEAFITSTIQRIGIGHSRAMYRVTAADGSRVVVRIEQGGVFGTTGAEESAVMRGLFDVGYPVAQILIDDPTGEAIGRPLFVMEYLDGADSPGADERAIDGPTAESFVDALSVLHAIDGATLGFHSVPGTPNEATPLQVERWRDVYRSAAASPNPLLEEAAAWLVYHSPPLERLAVVHGDAGPGNFVHRDGRVVALTDWEFSHLGDPAEDWSFCRSMRGSRTMPSDAWLQLFSARAGVHMAEDRWRYWEAFNLFKGACANRTCLGVFEDGRNRAPNMAIIGTALHQVFLRRLVAIVHDDDLDRSLRSARSSSTKPIT
jgi:aminoglycoside phosphotransferase (APT) family kinase protein